MSFQIYPSYKDSGLELIGEIPVDWLISRLKFIAIVNMGQSPNSEDCNDVGDGLPFLQGNAEFGVKNPTPRQYCPEPRKIAKPGDLLFSVRAPVGALNEADRIYGIGRGLCAVTSKNEGMRGYLLWALTAYKEILTSASSGSTFESVSAEDVESLPMAVPNCREAHSIARFLDHETAKIDALIAEQQRLIELLKEKRQAVISHAVTKGLNPNAPMKDSGVEWLGEVPAHWEVGALRWHATIQGGIAKGKDYRGQNTVALPYLRVANVQDGYVDLTEVKEIEVLASEVGRYSLRPGDVLMNEGGDNDKLGRGTVWSGEIHPCLHQNHVFAIRPDARLAPEWLATYTQSFQARAYFFVNSKQSTNLASISASNVMGLILPIPPINEQKAVLSFLDNDLGKHDRLVSVASSTIELLRERRSTLISAAVTGKIDVRSWQADAAFSGSMPMAADEAAQFR